MLVAPDGTCIHYGALLRALGTISTFRAEHSRQRFITSRKGGTGGQVITRPQILADGGYPGIHQLYPEAIIPNGKPHMGILLKSKRRPIGSQARTDLSLNAFSGEGGVMGILQRPYRCERDSLNSLAKIVVVLTNLKTRTALCFQTNICIILIPRLKRRKKANLLKQRQHSHQRSQGQQGRKLGGETLKQSKKQS